MKCANCKSQTNGNRVYVCKGCRKRFCDLCADSLGYTCPECGGELVFGN